LRTPLRDIPILIANYMTGSESLPKSPRRSNALRELSDPPADLRVARHAGARMLRLDP
jgi:hypothetical protein